MTDHRPGAEVPETADELGRTAPRCRALPLAARAGGAPARQ